MRKRVPELAAASALVAVAAVPLFANPDSARVFEADRVLLARELGLLALAAACAFGRAGWPADRGGLLIAAGALLHLLGTLLACSFSDAPITAFAGDYGRQGGLLTDLALLGVLLGAVGLRQRPDRAELAIRLVIGGGASLAALAVADALGGASRAAAVAGGATFLGGGLALVAPLALARVRRPLAGAATILVFAGLVATGSRVAALAALAGCAAVGAVRGGRAARRILGALAIAAALVAAAALPPVRALLPEGSLPDRVGRLFSHGDVAQRLALYRDAAAGLAAHPDRLLTGRGPDSIGSTFSESIGEDLQRSLGGLARVDRTHCEWLDLLWTRGVFGALGFTLMLAGAVLRAIAGARRGDRLATGCVGLLAAATVDLLLAVPGIGSRLLFHAAIALAPGTAEDRTPDRYLDARGAGAAAAAAWLALGHAVGFGAEALAGLFLLPVLAGARAAEWIELAATLLAYAVLRGVVAMVGPPAIGIGTPEDEALRATLHLSILLAVMVFAVFRLATPRAPIASAPRARVAGAVLAAVLLAMLWRDDFARQIADLEAAAASEAHHRRGRPDLAVPLLERAAERAPEVVRYRLREAHARADVLLGAPRADLAVRVERWREIAGIIDRACRRAPRDAWLAAEGADALLRVRPLLGEHAPVAVAQALHLARAALRRAPTSTTVLAVAARAELEIGSIAADERARDLLERALAIDNAPGTTHLLLGRVHARLGEVAGAAWYYSIALRSGAGSAEAFAGIALATASQGGTEQAGTVLANLVDLVDRIDASNAGAVARDDVARAVAGARPLLRWVGYPQFTAMAEVLRRLRPGSPRTVDAVIDALSY